MILAPVAPVAGMAISSPVTIRLIGILDRVLVERVSDACEGLAVSGKRTLVVLVRDLTVMRDESLDRLLAIFAAYQTAGHRVSIDGTATWRKITAGRAARFTQDRSGDGRSTRRQIIICHSTDKTARTSPMHA